jgi:SAM-dependent methyltransferase
MALLEAVRDQYVEYPYPPRDPEDERTRLVHSLLNQLTFLNHLFWAGRRAIGADFRVLDAGCGTGDSTIALAEELRDTEASVVALDFSPASLAIARERAAVRGLTNIEFVEASIEDLPRLGLGPFDYIVSCGVLHHLASPEAGLAALRDVLKPDGGLGIMVYGRYGRTAIYVLQELFRLVAPPGRPAEQRLRTVKRVLGRLREGHVGTVYADGWGKEVERNGDAGLYDLFLHSQDRPYTVPQIYQWLEGAGLRLTSFAFPVQYDLRTWDDRLDVEHLSAVERQSLAELLHSRMSNHTFFATRSDHEAPRPPDADDGTAIPTWTYRDVAGTREQALAEGGTITLTVSGRKVEVRTKGLAGGLLRRVDGYTPLGEILRATEAAFSATNAKQVRSEWLRVFDALSSINYLAMNPAP